MWPSLVLCLTMGQLVMPVVGQHMNCSQPDTEVTACGKLSPNGCCAKGCVRNALGKCVAEDCMASWNGWLRRPVTMSCYFHWFLLIFTAIILAIVSLVVVLNVIFEVRICLRKRRLGRYVRFSGRTSPRSSVV